MARPKTVIFTVRGTYGFPFDMLRYDAAYPTDKGVTGLSRVARGENLKECAACEGTGHRPSTPDDIQGVEYTCLDCNGRGSKGYALVEIELVSSLGRVTDDRWRSFGWLVVNQRPGYY